MAIEWYEKISRDIPISCIWISRAKWSLICQDAPFVWDPISLHVSILNDHIRFIVALQRLVEMKNHWVFLIPRYLNVPPMKQVHYFIVYTTMFALSKCSTIYASIGSSKNKLIQCKQLNPRFKYDKYVHNHRLNNRFEYSSAKYSTKFAEGCNDINSRFNLWPILLLAGIPFFGGESKKEDKETIQRAAEELSESYRWFQ
jgi:hypothetical protein